MECILTSNAICRSTLEMSQSIWLGIMAEHQHQQNRMILQARDNQLPLPQNILKWVRQFLLIGKKVFYCSKMTLKKYIIIPWLSKLCKSVYLITLFLLISTNSIKRYEKCNNNNITIKIEICSITVNLHTCYLILMFCLKSFFF